MSSISTILLCLLVNFHSIGGNFCISFNALYPSAKQFTCWLVTANIMECSEQNFIRFFALFIYAPDSKVHEANMGPTWVLLAPDGPHVSPMNLAIRGILQAAIASLRLGWYIRNTSDITMNHCLKSASTSSQCERINHGAFFASK